MQNLVSVTETVPYSPEELLGKEDYFLDKIKKFIDRVRTERSDLADYQLDDVGFIPQKNAILIKLYFTSVDSSENTKDNSQENKVIDLTRYLQK